MAQDRLHQAQYGAGTRPRAFARAPRVSQSTTACPGAPACRLGEGRRRPLHPPARSVLGRARSRRRKKTVGRGEGQRRPLLRAGPTNPARTRQPTRARYSAYSACRYWPLPLQQHLPLELHGRMTRAQDQLAGTGACRTVRARRGPGAGARGWHKTGTHAPSSWPDTAPTPSAPVLVAIRGRGRPRARQPRSRLRRQRSRPPLPPSGGQSQRPRAHGRN